MQTQTNGDAQAFFCKGQVIVSNYKQEKLSITILMDELNIICIKIWLRQVMITGAAESYPPWRGCCSVRSLP
jgi:hypothetical protein